MKGIPTRLRALALTLVLLPLGARAVDAPGPPERGEQGNLIFDGVPARDPAIAQKLGQYLQSRQASFVDWLADGSLLISTRFGDAEQLHRVRTPLGAREQLTFLHDPVHGAAANPLDPDALIYMQDQGGDENQQLYLHRLDDGSTRRLTDGKSLQGPPLWASDGKRVAFFSDARDGVSRDIYVADTTSNATPRLVVASPQEAFSVLDWSFDDSKLLILNFVSVTESYLYVADVATGKLTPIEPVAKSKAQVSVSQARFSRDGRGVYFVSTHEGDFAEVRYTDLYTQATRSVAPQSRWDVELLELGADGHYLAYTLNEGGVSRVIVHDLANHSDLLLPSLPAGSVVSKLGFDRSGKRLAVDAESAQSPRDVYVYELGDAVTLTRWTHSEIGPLDPSRLVGAERFSFATWDEVDGVPRRIPGYVYRPATPGPHPVIIDIHGGPESQYRPVWSAFTQYLVNELGYAVVAPNVRGSSGYGLAYLALDDGKLREDAVRDIGSLLVWIGVQRDLDRGNVVVMGGSYGGYVALASLEQYGDRLAGGVDLVGISNFVTFLEKTSPYRRDQRRAEYGDERDPSMRAYLERISPLANVALLRKPLLIVAGLNDPRVPASESEQILWRVRAQGGEAWYLAARDEGHGFRKKGNRDAYLETLANFLAHLAQPAAP
jgi:dipeptidyl aminopeptidase/acylaminoacyl peptidase